MSGLDHHHLISVEPEIHGAHQPIKGDFPVRYGERVQVTTRELVVELDRSGRIKYLRGRSSRWPHPSEYLKRTDGNDWVYYSLGEYSDNFGLYGEHYLPCPAYPTNRPLGGEPFRRGEVQEVLRSWPDAIRGVRESLSSFPGELRHRLAANAPEALARHVGELHRILGTALPVLPPDARHVDYDVIPLIVSDGCRYGCRFCCVNDGRELAVRSRGQVEEQLEGLHRWLGRQAGNLQALFLGGHDALAADDDLLRFAVEGAYRRLGFAGSPFSRPHLYLFGSADSILAKSDAFFRWLDGIPWLTFINIGLEGADDETLKILGKPLSASKVDAAFGRLVDVNARHANVEVTANFVLLSAEAERADEAMVGLVNSHLSRRTSRGACYLSPLMVGGRRPRMNRRALIERMHRLQRALPLQLLLYLIQRL